MKQLIRFIEKSTAFDNRAKLRAILFLNKLKPSTYIQLRIGKNLHDKHEFEKLLKSNKILFKVSKAKGYEEIVRMKKNAAVWKLQGTWYGYDLFQNKQEKQKFGQYVSYVKKLDHEKADTLAGQLYGYPACCIKQFIQEHDAKKLARKYSYYQFYKRLHDSDKAFPFLQHTPCKKTCKRSTALNKKYNAAVKKSAPAFYKEYVKKKNHRAQVIVDTESDITFKGISVWKKKDGHDYSLVTKKPIKGRHYLISWLTKRAYTRGTILSGTITMQYNYATFKATRKSGTIKNFHHERRFTRL
jgi:hypothetical protein